MDRRDSKRLLVDGASLEDIEKVIRRAVQADRGQLKEKIEDLIFALRRHGKVLTLSQCVPHFDGKVTAQTIKEDYVKGKRLPKGVHLPLPARKVGHNFFIAKGMLDKWRMGEVELSDLHPWQQEKFEGD